MKNKKKHTDPIPEEFSSYEEAAEFWDTHDTTDYPEAFKTMDVQVEYRKRHYEIEVDEDVIKVLRERAKHLGVTINNLVNDLLRSQLSAAS